LLKDALLRTAQAADIAGIRCLLVHAKDEAARQWYESWEFEPSPTDPYHLFLMLKDLKVRCPREHTMQGVGMLRLPGHGRKSDCRSRRCGRRASSYPGASACSSVGAGA
jgi:hypothetical protein